MKSMGKWARHAMEGLATGLMLGLLMSCGGGTEQVDPFRPTRYFVFGDEMSVLTNTAPLGRKYTVNAVGSDGVGIDCAANTDSQPSRLWTQILAGTFNFVFAECNPSALSVNAFIYAAPDAKSENFADQLAAARVVHGSFGCNDLMSVLIGANDVLDVYNNVYKPDPLSTNYTDNPTYRAGLSAMQARGTRLGRAITALTAGDGPSIIVSTIPLMNLTPYARQQVVGRPDPNAINVLNQFSNAFNTALRTNIPNDGSRWGLVELDALLNAGVNNPDNYGLDNVTQAVCKATATLPNCRNIATDLVPNGNPETWLWASDLWMGWQAHSRLGSFARTRARDNPFGCS